MMQVNVPGNPLSFSGAVSNLAVEKAVWDKIIQINFSQVESKLRNEKKWTAEEANQAIQAYRIFLLLSYRAQKLGLSVVPFHIVDQVWHAHILQSIQKYRSETTEALGFELDHIATASDEVPGKNSVLMGRMLKDQFLPLVAHNSDHAGCDGHAQCEFGDWLAR